jgi:hypothetical protein
MKTYIQLVGPKLKDQSDKCKVAVLYAQLIGLNDALVGLKDALNNLSLLDFYGEGADDRVWTETERELQEAEILPYDPAEGSFLDLIRAFLAEAETEFID